MASASPRGESDTEAITSSTSEMPRTPAVAKRKLLNFLPNLLVFIVTFIHVFGSPFTKVEESFALHAFHDFLQLGNHYKHAKLYDHVTFPGAVPRSFFLPMTYSFVLYPFAALGVHSGLIKSKMDVQILVRLCLASLHAYAFNHLQRTIRRKYGPISRVFFVAISLSQFHIPYYAGRTLPNFIAMPPVMISISFLLCSTFASSPAAERDRLRRLAIKWLTFVAANTRLELAAFVVPIAAGMVLTGRMSFGQALYSGALGGFGALILGGSHDLILWHPHPPRPKIREMWQFVWPELASFHYNVFQGQSAKWGTMPVHYYLTNSLPKLLMGAFPLVVLGYFWAFAEGLAMLGGKRKGDDGKANAASRGLGRAVNELMGLFGPGVLGLLGSMSMVGHKEWRFIVYVVPIFNIVAAITASSLWVTTAPSLRSLVRLGLVGLVLANIAGTIGFTFVSSQNYPGGKVSAALERIQHGSNDTVTIHYHSYPLQTGASLFTFDHTSAPSAWRYPAVPLAKSPTWIYSKSEDPAFNTPEGAWKQGVDYVVTEDWDAYARYGGGKRWEVAEEISGFAGIRRGGRFFVEPKWGTELAILRRIP